MRITRRELLQGSLALPFLPAAKKLPLAFSTLGCPKWPWARVLEEATRSGYAAVELRGIEGEMDLTKRPEFSPSRIAGSLRELEERDIKISDLGASARMHESDPEKRRAQIDEGKRFIDLAHKLNCPYVRVFPDKLVPNEPKSTTVARIAAGLRELGEHARGAGVGVIMESHGDITDSPTLLEILKASEMPEVGLLWDTHHTVVEGHETPEETFRRVARYVRHTHIKDSKPDGKGGHSYVLTGQGTVPVREIVRVLARGGYRGYYCFEWEKAWHPEIDEPEVAIPHFAKTVREYLEEAGAQRQG